MGFIESSIYRNDFMPVLSLIWESRARENESFMIYLAVEALNEADKFGGVPYLEEVKKGNSPITVYISLIFPTQKEIDEFIKAYLPK